MCLSSRPQSRVRDRSLPDPGTHCAAQGPAAAASPGTVRHGDSGSVQWLIQNLTMSPLQLRAHSNLTSADQDYLIEVPVLLLIL